MKLLSLNTAGATQGKIFFDYIRSIFNEVDIFCFQELFSSNEQNSDIALRGDYRMYEKLEAMLYDFRGYFLQRSENHDFHDRVSLKVKHGLGIFVKKSIEVKSYEYFFVVRTRKIQHPVEGEINCQKIVCSLKNNDVCVINYHGPAQPGNKLDTEDRVLASKKLKEIWTKEENSNKILCGDFNLMPGTKSIELLDELGVNLIKKYKIENTRNEISWTKYKNQQSFADYVFVSKDVDAKVKSFEVPYNLASDHLPMILDFEIN